MDEGQIRNAIFFFFVNFVVRFESLSVSMDIFTHLNIKNVVKAACSMDIANISVRMIRDTGVLNSSRPFRIKTI